MYDPRYPQLPMTQGDWSNTFSGLFGASPVNPQATVDSGAVPLPPPRPSGFTASPAVVANVPLPPRRPANLGDDNSWNPNASMMPMGMNQIPGNLGQPSLYSMPPGYYDPTSSMRPPVYQPVPPHTTTPFRGYDPLSSMSVALNDPAANNTQAIIQRLQGKNGVSPLPYAWPDFPWLDIPLP